MECRGWGRVGEAGTRRRAQKVGSWGPPWEQPEGGTVGEAAVWEGGRRRARGWVPAEGKGGEEMERGPGGSAGNGPGGAGGAAGQGLAGGWCWWLFLYNGQVVKT